MKSQRDVSSFVLRFTQDLWQDLNGEPHIEWRGHIQRVQDGAEIHFTDLITALCFIQKSLLQLTSNAVCNEVTIDGDRALQESLRFWEKFATSDAHKLAEAIQLSMPQTGGFQAPLSQRLEQPTKPGWQLRSAENGELPPTAVAETPEQTLAALHLQIQALTSKVHQLEAEVQTLASPQRGANPPTIKRNRNIKKLL